MQSSKPKSKFWCSPPSQTQNPEAVSRQKEQFIGPICILYSF